MQTYLNFIKIIQWNLRNSISFHRSYSQWICSVLPKSWDDHSFDNTSIGKFGMEKYEIVWKYLKITENKLILFFAATINSFYYMFHGRWRYTKLIIILLVKKCLNIVNLHSCQTYTEYSKNYSETIYNLMKVNFFQIKNHWIYFQRSPLFISTWRLKFKFPRLLLPKSAVCSELNRFIFKCVTT